MSERPLASEYAPYFGKYVALVPDGDIVELFGSIEQTTLGVLRGVSEERSLHRYAAGKWSIREMYLHLVDAERVFSYRGLRIARGDQTPLAGFEQDDYIGPSAADLRSWKSILEEYSVVRRATVALFQNLPSDAWMRSGTASEKPVTVRAIAYIIAGHDLHHTSILQERYLSAAI